jgi:UDP-N-acetylmuramate--alanine ligase
MGELVSSGAVVFIGHDAVQLPDETDLVVASAAIPDSNPELVLARSRGMRVIRYAEMIGMLMDDAAGVAIAGTHGKSTTTAMTAYLFRRAGLDPSFVVGARSEQLGGASGVGSGPHFIVESCEYARSFLHLRPQLGAVLNIELEHLDCYSGLDDIVSAFSEFIGNISSTGTVIVGDADVNVRAALAAARCSVETVGFGESAVWRAADLVETQGSYRFAAEYRGSLLFETSLKLAGRHNVTNALTAAALAWRAGATADVIAEALAEFEGIDRRMMLRGTERGVTVVDDYAHHPTEIAATLLAVRSRYQPKRTWVVFQPHQHSRTRHLMEQFSRCFSGADMVLVPDIYAVRDTEEDRRLTGSADLVSRISAAGGAARHVPALNDIVEQLRAETVSGDLVITMGAGDVWKVADGLVR